MCWGSLSARTSFDNLHLDLLWVAIRDRNARQLLLLLLHHHLLMTVLLEPHLHFLLVLHLKHMLLILHLLLINVLILPFLLTIGVRNGVRLWPCLNIKMLLRNVLLLLFCFVADWRLITIIDLYLLVINFLGSSQRCIIVDRWFFSSLNHNRLVLLCLILVVIIRELNTIAECRLEVEWIEQLRK